MALSFVGLLVALGLVFGAAIVLAYLANRYTDISEKKERKKKVGKKLVVRPATATLARAALRGTKIIDEGRYYCGPHHHRRCHYANARADDCACATGNESSSSLASNNADYGFRRNRATHERKRQSYYRNNLH